MTAEAAAWGAKEVRIMVPGAPVTEGIASFALGLDLRAVPATEVRRATRLLAERLAAHARRRSAADGPRATLLAAPGSADPPLAALANGTAVRMLDANDLYCSRFGGHNGGH